MWWQADDSSEESVSSEETAEIPEDDIDKWIEEREAGIDAERAEEHAEMARDEIDLLIEKREAAIDAERAQQYAEMALDEFDALLEEHERAIDAERALQYEELARDEMRHGDTSCAQGIVSSAQNTGGSSGVKRSAQGVASSAQDTGGSSGVKRRRLKGKQRVGRAALPTSMLEAVERCSMHAEDKAEMRESMEKSRLHVEDFNVLIWRSGEPPFLRRQRDLEVKRELREEQLHSCAVCKRMSRAVAFDFDMLRNARNRQSKLVCRECCDLGYSPKDCTEYKCSGGHSCGHQHFDPQHLADWKRKRASTLTCNVCRNSDRGGSQRKRKCAACGRNRRQ